jgi:hypothetical protein
MNEITDQPFRGDNTSPMLRFGCSSARVLPLSGVEAMNHLLTGTAFAAALATTAVVWAQTPTSPNPAGAPPAPSTRSAPSATPQTAPSTSQTAPYAQQAPAQPRAPSATTTEPMPKRHAMHQARHGRHAAHTRSTHRMRHAPLASRGSRAPNDNIANQLNSQELGRVSGSSAPPAGYAPQQGQPQGYPQQGQPPSGPRY